MNAFLDALQASGPAEDRDGKMELYAWLIGSWEIDVIETAPDGGTRRRLGEWHFGWALEGRAIQDVWIVPRRGARNPANAVADAAYCGSTLRVYDPRIDAWHIRWTDPVSQSYLSQIGRKDGDRIVQEGKDAMGKPRRWSFSEITPDSFLWRGEVSDDGGTNWFTHMEFQARRTAL